MGTLIVILSLLVLSTISGADVELVCDTTSVVCPSGERTVARCTSSSRTIVWKASLDSQSKSVALDFSDTGHYSRSVTVNGVKVMFVKQGDGLSFAVIPSPNVSLNGLQLSCADMLHSVSSSCVLDNFFDSSDLLPPQNLSFVLSSIMFSSVDYTWAPPISDHSCSDHSYRVKTRVNGVTRLADTMLTSDTIVVSGEGFYKEHCVGVATVGKDNRTGSYTPNECITMDIPVVVVIADPQYIHTPPPTAAVVIAEPEHAVPPMGMGRRRVTVGMSWNYIADSRPPVIWYHVTHDLYESEADSSVTMTVDPSTNQLLFTDVEEGRWYTFSVIAENVLGNGAEAVIRFFAKSPRVLTPATTILSLEPLATPTGDSSSDTTLPMWQVVAITVGGAIVAAMMVA